MGKAIIHNSDRKLPIIEMIANISDQSIEKSLDSNVLSEAIATTDKQILSRLQALAIAQNYRKRSKPIA